MTDESNDKGGKAGGIKPEPGTVEEKSESLTRLLQITEGLPVDQARAILLLFQQEQVNKGKTGKPDRRAAADVSAR